jgi:nucleoside-diphosphate-sugar epimerase
MKKVLVLGGTRFFGQKLVERLIQAGHEVTILTRGQSDHPFGERVEQLIADRYQPEELAAAVENRTFDLVYDNICYSPNAAKQFCDIFNGKIGKLVFTSTLATYEASGEAHVETDFDPYTYEIVMGDTNDFSYGEGKRQAEAVFFQYAKFPVVAVRFPIVMGEDDYTRRLHFHIEHTLQGKPMGFVNMDAEMSFILAEEAADFLKFAGDTNIEGPFNATSTGTISLQHLIELVEEATSKRARIALLGNDESRSPYAIPKSWYMLPTKAQQAGFTFSELHTWLRDLVQAIATTAKQGD